MKTKTGITLAILIVLVLSGCEKAGKTFEISGSPDPLLYGYCNEPTLTFTVTGPGDGLRVDGVIVAYNLFNESGVKVKSGSLSLTYSPFHPAVTYIGSVTFKIAAPGSVSPPYDAIMDFGEGKVEFAATVSAFKLSPDGGATYFITSTKSVRVIPCGPTPPPPPPGAPKPTVTPIPTPTASPTPPPTVAPDMIPTKNCNPLKQQCP